MKVRVLVQRAMFPLLNTGPPCQRVLTLATRAHGRAAPIKTVFGKKPDILQQRFMQSVVHLLLYWRDESAHRKTSGISELETYHALTLLLRIAGYFFDEWDRITKGNLT